MHFRESDEVIKFRKFVKNVFRFLMILKLIFLTYVLVAYGYITKNHIEVVDLKNWIINYTTCIITIFTIVFISWFFLLCSYLVKNKYWKNVYKILYNSGVLILLLYMFMCDLYIITIGFDLKDILNYKCSNSIVYKGYACNFYKEYFLTILYTTVLSLVFDILQMYYCLFNCIDANV